MVGIDFFTVYNYNTIVIAIVEHEPGQDRKIAALSVFAMCGDFFYRGIAMEKYFIEQALLQSNKARSIDEVPIGALIVKDNKIIATAYNKKEKNKNPLGHAELIAIKKACKKLRSWRLNGCSIYVTLEPCSMCLSAIIQARIDNVYFGASDPKSGACGGLFNLLDQKGFNHYPNIKNLKIDACSTILKDYFKSKRNNSK